MWQGDTNCSGHLIFCFQPLSVRQKGCFILLSYCSLATGLPNPPPHMPNSQITKDTRESITWIAVRKVGQHLINKFGIRYSDGLVNYGSIQGKDKISRLQCYCYGYSHRYMHSVLWVSRHIELLSSKARFSGPGLARWTNEEQLYITLFITR